MALSDNSHEPFDPLAVENIGVTLAVELLEQPVAAVPPEEVFRGPGIYTLYYTGNHEAYQSLQALDAGRFIFPVYVGRALRRNARQGFSPTPSTASELRSRIGTHARSIEQAANLEVTDFKCRYLVLQDAYIALAESILIMAFRPPWNGMGIGSNAVGGPRMAGLASLWDSLHPGRGGRPAGLEDRAREAFDKIRETAAQLIDPPLDPVSRRIYDKIMRFV
ncbi:Eco29kI family restriction endonuclease [Thalassospiraceae bacterium LMO-SO8]|nr:Eco29kI family restriction endonuclease [Alphaproteobacteria bacterium LMO-S08]WND77373.1 Eco29kI family restriction endonuclease [Thalassospiraceae bacterium LMO-SO8]